jgi:hypothetical protein
MYEKKVKFTKEDLSLWIYKDDYFVDILNGEYSVEEAREDLISLMETDERTCEK